MNLQYVGHCDRLGLHIVNGHALNPRIKQIGFLSLKDRKGSIYPIFSYDKLPSGNLLIPSLSLNDQEREILTATTISLTGLMENTGFLTVCYALQPDGMEFAVVDIEEGVTDYARAVCLAFGLDAAEVELKLLEQPSMSFLGYLPDPDKTAVWSEGRLTWNENR